MAGTFTLSSPLLIPFYSCTNSHTVGKHTFTHPPKTPHLPGHFVVEGKIPTTFSVSLTMCMCVESTGSFQIN